MLDDELAPQRADGVCEGVFLVGLESQRPALSLQPAHTPQAVSAAAHGTAAGRTPEPSLTQASQGALPASHGATAATTDVVHVEPEQRLRGDGGVQVARLPLAACERAQAIQNDGLVEPALEPPAASCAATAAVRS